MTMLLSRAMAPQAAMDLWNNPAAWTGSPISISMAAESQSGVKVDTSKAMTYSAFFNGVTLIAETIALMPHHVMRREGNRRHSEDDHILNELVNSRPNPEMTAQSFKETTTAFAITWGNGLAEIERDGTGRPVHLWPLIPSRVKLERDAKAPANASGMQPLLYVVHNNAGEVEAAIRAEDMLHIKAFSGDGLWGASVVQMAQESLGLGIAAEEYGARYFKSDTTPTGVITHPGELPPEAKKRMRESWESMHSGTNRHRVAILEEGVTWQSIGLPPEQAQFLETRTFQVSEVSRWLKIPPPLLSDLTHAHFRNLEQLIQAFVSGAILPWVKRWEGESDYKLLDDRERRSGLYSKINLNSLLRGDSKARAEFYRIMSGIGAMSPNDVRRLEDMDPVEGGDAYLVPLNMRPIDQPMERKPAEVIATGKPKALPAVKLDYQKAASHVFADAAGRMLTKEINAVQREAERTKGLDFFVAAIRIFYEKHQTTVCRAMTSPAETLAHLICSEHGLPGIPAEIHEALGKEIRSFAQDYCGDGIAEVQRAFAGGTVDSLCQLWTVHRPQQATERITGQLAWAVMGAMKERDDDAE